MFIDFLPVLKYDPNMSRLTSGCFVNEKAINSRNMGAILLCHVVSKHPSSLMPNGFFTMYTIALLSLFLSL